MTNWPSRDPSVYTRPGPSSIRAAALWDAIYELVVGGTVGITNEGAQLLVDQGIAQHEAKPDPHPVYVTVPEGDLRWGASSGLAPHTHEAEESGGLIDYLRTQWGVDHLAAVSPHPQYQTVPQVQALVDAGIAALKAESDPLPIYLRQAEADLLYLPLSYAPPPPDLSNYWTKAQADSRFVDVVGDQMTGMLSIEVVEGNPALYVADPADGFARLQVSGGAQFRFGDGAQALDTTLERSSIGQLLIDPDLQVGRDLDVQHNAYVGNNLDVNIALSVANKPVALSGQAGNTLQWLATGWYSDSPSKATIDALTSRVATLEAQVAALQGQMGSGATGHYHPMGTWRQTAKAVIPVTMAEEVPVG